MITLDLDLSTFKRAAQQMKAAQDQVPFALSQALNTAARNTRDLFIYETWPRYVEVRNRNFLRNALRVQFASKRNLAVAITSEGTSAGNRAHLKLHADGGTKQSRGRLAIPSRNVRRTAKGVSASQRPAALANSFRDGDSIFQRLGNGRRRLMYTLKPSAQIKPDVPFRAEFVRNMRREMMGQFKLAMMQAMRTRR